MTGPIRAEDVEPEKVEWLWRERIPRSMITVIAGRPEQGKGLFAAYLAAEVSNTPMIDRVTGELRYGQVLYSAIEDAHGLMTRPRLEAAGAKLENVQLWRFQIPAMLKELEAHIIEMNIDLVVMDPVSAHLSHGVSKHSDKIRTVLNPLSELLEATGCALLMVEHVNKRVPKGSHPLNAIGGSGSGIPAAARMAYVLGKDPADEDSRMLCAVKSNLRSTPKAVRFEVDTVDIDKIGVVPFLGLEEDDVEFDPMRLFDGKAEAGAVGRPPDKRAAACEWLTNYLFDAGKPVKAGQVMEDAKQHAMSPKTLRRAADEMEVVRNPPGGGRNCTWELPQETIDALTVDVEEDPEEGMLSQDDIDALLGNDPIPASEDEEEGDEDA
jgi:hypothetical protein